MVMLVKKNKLQLYLMREALTCIISGLLGKMLQSVEYVPFITSNTVTVVCIQGSLLRDSLTELALM